MNKKMPNPAAMRQMMEQQEEAKPALTPLESPKVESIWHIPDYIVGDEPKNEAEFENEYYQFNKQLKSNSSNQLLLGILLKPNIGYYQAKLVRDDRFIQSVHTVLEDIDEKTETKSKLAIAYLTSPEVTKDERYALWENLYKNYNETGDISVIEEVTRNSLCLPPSQERKVTSETFLHQAIKDKNFRLVELLSTRLPQEELLKTTLSGQSFAKVLAEQARLTAKKHVDAYSLEEWFYLLDGLRKAKKLDLLLNSKTENEATLHSVLYQIPDMIEIVEHVKKLETKSTLSEATPPILKRQSMSREWGNAKNLNTSDAIDWMVSVQNMDRYLQLTESKTLTDGHIQELFTKGNGISLNDRYSKEPGFPKAGPLQFFTTTIYKVAGFIGGGSNNVHPAYKNDTLLHQLVNHTPEDRVTDLFQRVVKMASKTGSQVDLNIKNDNNETALSLLLKKIPLELLKNPNSEVKDLLTTLSTYKVQDINDKPISAIDFTAPIGNPETTYYLIIRDRMIDNHMATVKVNNAEEYENEKQRYSLEAGEQTTRLMNAMGSEKIHSTLIPEPSPLPDILKPKKDYVQEAREIFSSVIKELTPEALATMPPQQMELTQKQIMDKLVPYSSTTQVREYAKDSVSALNKLADNLLKCDSAVEREKVISMYGPTLMPIVAHNISQRIEYLALDKTSNFTDFTEKDKLFCEKAKAALDALMVYARSKVNESDLLNDPYAKLFLVPNRLESQDAFNEQNQGNVPASFFKTVGLVTLAGREVQPEADHAFSPLMSIENTFKVLSDKLIDDYHIEFKNKNQKMFDIKLMENMKPDKSNPFPLEANL